MANESFRSVLLSGHKGAAVEVPFDPSSRWGSAAEPLWRGRRGHAVCARLNGVRFESWIVPRSKRFWMLVDEALLKSAEVEVGDTVRITLEPISAGGLPKRRPRPSSGRKRVELPTSTARARSAGSKGARARRAH